MTRSVRYSSPEVLARIAKLDFRARQAVHGTMVGVNRSPLLGQSVEFKDYREYSPGDDLRKVDWKAYARHGRYLVKLFEEESNLRGHLVLDASASMRYGSGPLNKYAYGATLVASLATLMVEQRDAASLLLADTAEREYLEPATSRLHLSHLIATLEGSQPDRSTELGPLLARKVGSLPTRGVLILVSDLLTDLDALGSALGAFLHRGHEVIIFHLLDPDELELPFEGQIEFHDLESSDRVLAEPKYFRAAYRSAMQDFCKDVERRALNLGAEYLMVRTDQDLAVVLSGYLHWRDQHLGRGRQGRAAGRAAKASRGAPGAGPVSGER